MLSVAATIRSWPANFGLRFYAGVPLRTHDGHNLGTLCVIDREPRPITEQQIDQLRSLGELVVDQLELRLSARLAVAELSEAMTAKDAALESAAMMAKEIDHRVMNSLQMVSALLNVQSRERGPVAPSAQLALAASRISGIAQVHRHIYQSEKVGKIECGRYLQSLCADLSTGIGLDQDSRVVVRCANVEVTTEFIAPLGLIVAELVTNAAKNGAATITVSLDASPNDHYTISVADDGAGLPDGFDPATGRGLGMKVVSSLARQLGGSLSYGPSDEGGARLAVEFPKPDPQ